MQTELPHFLSYFTAFSFPVVIFSAGMLWNRVQKIEAWIEGHEQFVKETMEKFDEVRIMVTRVEQQQRSLIERFDRLSQRIH